MTILNLDIFVKTKNKLAKFGIIVEDMRNLPDAYKELKNILILIHSK